MKIYKVSTEGDCEGRTYTTLGYASGKPEDIKQYFDDMKGYSIHLDEIEILQIGINEVKQKVSDIARKKDLEDELEILNRRLRRK